MRVPGTDAGARIVRRLQLMGSTALLLALCACGAASQAAASSALPVYAISATDTPVPPATPAPAPPLPSATPPPPSPTPTAGPIVFTLDFGAERRDDVTLHVGQAIQLRLTTGPTSDWVSGVDDARVLRPMSADGNGIYQAVAAGTALVTAHAPYGCANVFPNRACKNPETGVWFQTRVYVVP